MTCEKSIYKASKNITPEEMSAKRGKITISEIRTAEYLRRLENAPSDPRDEFRRYKG